MRLRRREARTHRIHGHVAGAQCPPGLDTPVPFVFVEPLNADPRINTKIFAIAASLFEIAMDLLEVDFDLVIWCPPTWHPPITEPCGALERGLGSTPEPDGDGALYGQRINPGIVNDVVGGLVGDQRLRPELTQHRDLLFGPTSAHLKFLAEHVVLDVIPANPNAKTQTSATQHIDLRSLLGDQGGLALRQNEDARHQSKPRGDGSEKAEEHHGLVKRMLIRVRPRKLRLPVRMRPEHVVVDDQIVIAEGFSGLGIILDRLYIVAKFSLGKYNAVVHESQTSRGAPWRAKG